jgi:hypothetical protein
MSGRLTTEGWALRGGKVGRGLRVVIVITVVGKQQT